LHVAHHTSYHQGGQFSDPYFISDLIPYKFGFIKQFSILPRASRTYIDALNDVDAAADIN
jgi:hypothetical protein